MIAWITCDVCVCVHLANVPIIAQKTYARFITWIAIKNVDNDGAKLVLWNRSRRAADAIDIYVRRSHNNTRLAHYQWITYILEPIPCSLLATSKIDFQTFRITQRAFADKVEFA